MYNNAVIRHIQTLLSEEHRSGLADRHSFTRIPASAKKNNPPEKAFNYANLR